MRLVRSLGVAAIAALTGLTGATVASAADGIGLFGTQLAPDQIGRSANVQHLFNTPHAGPLASGTGTDIAFSGNKAFVGNYNGFVIYDISNPASPTKLATVNCPGAQNDVTISGTLLYLSTDSSRNNSSCSSAAQSATIKASWEGIKIFDVSVPTNPTYVAAVETKCGSHTNTLVPGGANDYIYVSSYSPSTSTPDCLPPHDLISIVEVPKANPTAARVVATPNLFPDGGTQNGKLLAGGTSGCHDITAFPAKGIAAGACMGDGIIMDISNPVAPTVLSRVSDRNFAFWHSATFNQDATKVVFTDELGGGAAATCDAKNYNKRGADAIYDVSATKQMTFKSYFKIARHQGKSENCVAHNGSIIPVAGRDVMVQSWYMGGTSFWDFTNSAAPREIGYFERGPNGGLGGGGGGTWSSYYYNGHVYSSDLGKGFDVLRITDPDLQGAALVQMGELNPQSQPVYATP